MKQTIKYVDVSRQFYKDVGWVKDDVDKKLEGKQIINIETLKHKIRFWYKED